MKIKVINNTPNSWGIFFTLNYEQETLVYNNVCIDVVIGASETEGLSEDEIITLAHTKAYPKAVSVFEKIEYGEESLNAQGFELIESRDVSIYIDCADNVKKKPSENLTLRAKAFVVDQYGQHTKEIPVLLDGVELSGDWSCCDKESTTHTLSSSYAGLSGQKDVAVEVYETAEDVEIRELKEEIQQLKRNSANNYLETLNMMSKISTGVDLTGGGE